MNKTGFDDLDKQLQQLAATAQQYQLLTRRRQLALTLLVQMILKSGRLCHPYQGQFLTRYEEIYEEARQELFFYICQNIEKYDPQRGSVMAWCNFLLERRFFREAIPKVLEKQGIKKITLSDLDDFIAAPEEPPKFADLLKECIEQDVDDIFKNEFIKSHPTVNFQALAMRRISGKSWKEISAELEMKIPTLSSFYYRCINKFSKRLKEYCIDREI